MRQKPDMLSDAAEKLGASTFNSQCFAAARGKNHEDPRKPNQRCCNGSTVPGTGRIRPLGIQTRPLAQTTPDCSSVAWGLIMNFRPIGWLMRPCRCRDSCLHRP